MTPARFPSRCRKLPRFCALLLAAGSPALADSMSGKYTIRDLGAGLGPGGISSAGDIVLGDGTGWGFPTPISVDRDGKSTYLTPIVPVGPDGTFPSNTPIYSRPAMSTGGTIVYNYYRPTADPATSTTPNGVSLVAGGQTTDLGNLTPPGIGPDGAYTTATGVNDRGEVVGTATPGFSLDGSGNPNISSPVGYVSTDRGTGGRQTYSLGKLAPAAINNQGIIAGTTTIDPQANITRATIAGVRNGTTWQTDLGTLGGQSSRANAINDAGQVVGASNIPDSQVDLPKLADGSPIFSPSDVFHAFVTRDGKMVDLGSLPDAPFDFSEATGINGAGWIVGNTLVHPFLYRDGKMTDLNDLLPADSGWELLKAIGINDAGQIIGLGNYRDPNSTDPSALLTMEPFVMSIEPVPEPASVLVFALAGAALAIRHRANKRGQVPFPR